MKYVIVIPDGCADEPLDSLNGLTPLQAARIPQMDAVVQAGIVGRANNVPDHLQAGSDVANMSLLGYDPNLHFTGRAPIEAFAQGIKLGPNDWAIRCNLVTVVDEIMRDFTADHISSEEAALLLQTLQQATTNPQLSYLPGVSYRNLLIFREGQQAAPFDNETWARPPHDLTDKTVVHDYPRGSGADFLKQLMQHSSEVFAGHRVNTQRVSAGKLPATQVWLWGVGRTPVLENFKQKFGVRGAMITAVDLLRGLAALVGWQNIEVPGATGYTDTDYAAKGRYAIQALDDYDIVCVHVEATDEASHEGDAAKKIEALQEIDEKIVGPIHSHLQSRGDDYRLLVTPDHPTMIRTKTHSHGFVPFAICGAGITAENAATYDEITAGQSSHHFAAGWELMPFFLGQKK
jgi:2,3-bisphosphoglycerate-independent phosphoglycerate mutase